MKTVFVVLGAIVLVGVLAYMQSGFQGADAKTAIRLVEEATVGGEPLGQRMEEYVPLPRRLCEVKVLSRFYGHLEVSCQDVGKTKRVLKWRVNVVDGMVQPANEAARRLGEGQEPWEKKK